MHDIRAIREEPDIFDRNWARRGLPGQADVILKLDEGRRAAQTELQNLQQTRKQKSLAIGLMKHGKAETKDGEDVKVLMDEVAALKDRMTALEAQEATLAESLNQHLAVLPNLLDDDVPDGKDESANKEVRKSGEPPRRNDTADHADIGAKLGMMDFATAVKMSGSRFVLMHSDLARLDRALGQFMLDLHTQEHGYTEVSPPLLVNNLAAFGTGQLPKFQNDLFSAANVIEEIPISVKKPTYWEIKEHIRNTPALKSLDDQGQLDIVVVLNKDGKEECVKFKSMTSRQTLEDLPIVHRSPTDEEVREHIVKTPRLKTLNEKGELEVVLIRKSDGTEKCFRFFQNRWLIPTAEVSLTNMVADMILDAEALPLRFTACTPCFRSEAGAAGKDTKGMIRQHQFYKVELVSITHPEKSNEEHERMTQCAETILKKLGLAFRTMVLCAGDTGFGARKTYDIEVWLPGQGRYREISSCSNCGDFQARRMKARFRARGEKDTQFMHTLNGSGVAVGRALIAVLENYWNPADNSVTVPDVLRPYMGGLEKIEALADSKGPLLVASG